MQRRDFIKTSCIACATAVGASALASLLNSCTPLTLIKTEAVNGTIIIPKTAFTDNQKQLLVRNSKMEYDILLIKKTDEAYNALYMQCSHENQPLNANKSGLFCSSHGSAFDFDGNVTQQPASKPLRKFKTQSTNESIIIYLN